ncbi:MAG: putative selenate reductase subunit YgfK [Oscillospiraceae bacterium]|nr:putative selenate reductase subunit YgfK [Oscillospiraceae bacterium]
MSEKMTPIPFAELMRWSVAEYETYGTMFGVERAYRKKSSQLLPIFGETLETPFGPAAGPNTQLTQNIVASYFAGSRFFELKTVQEMDGDALAACVNRPCILADDEGYNCEWSTELYVKQALEEYVKAWVMLKFFASHYCLGDPNGFVFNISVGYNLADIKKEKTDTFIDSMKDASALPVFQSAIHTLKAMYPDEIAYINTIPATICRSVTVSTLHGCPPQEIEAIASYLLSEKGMHTYVKCNPTLLGYQTARQRLDAMGYDYIQFGEFHFNDDLQWKDAVPMFTRLRSLADSLGLEFGLKLSNTFPVDVKQHELPSAEMYMSGRSLYPLTIEMANRIAKQFGGRMRISYAGGADAFNIEALFDAGIWPITMATTVLKPGGYTRMVQIAEELEQHPFREFECVDQEKVAALSKAALEDAHHRKPVKPQPSRKSEDAVPLLDCYIAPCKGGCPIRQDIPEYIELCGKGMYDEALRLIAETNALPFITGTICAHRCMGKCTRNFYEEPVHIRDTKLLAAQMGYEALLKSVQSPARVPGKKVAVIGGGPTGIAAGYFLGRAGIETTIFEREAELGGIVRYVIPEFRISQAAIDRDVALMQAYGTKAVCGKPAPSVAELKAMGYTHILFAVGAWKAGRLDLSGNVQGVIQWMKDQKAGAQAVPRNVVVIGGGNTAMDAARVAKHAGARSMLVYRRTKRYMPADAQELELAMADGVEFIELAAPVEQKDGTLVLNRMELGAPDASGRRSPIPTGDTFSVPCDLVISAVGEQVDSALLAANGIAVDRKGRPSFQTNLENVYAAGDATRGPATVVEGIADAARFAALVIGAPHTYEIPKEAYPTAKACVAKKGILRLPRQDERERCLGCDTVCQNCADVCPNRANAVIRMDDGRRQILHIDRMCNECGNCETFCPYASAPCKDKFTLYHTAEDFANSKNAGFLVLNGGSVQVRLGDSVAVYDITAPDCALYAGLKDLIATVLNKYAYLL